MFICEISIIIVLICRKLGSVRSIQQKIKLPSLIQDTYLDGHVKFACSC